MTKRFIAGAVCPKCSKMDKIVMFKEGSDDWRECVSCGYKDKMHFQNQSRELETRVNVTEQDKKDQVQVIQLEPLGKKH